MYCKVSLKFFEIKHLKFKTSTTQFRLHIQHQRSAVAFKKHM